VTKSDFLSLAWCTKSDKLCL